MIAKIAHKVASEKALLIIFAPAQESSCIATSGDGFANRIIPDIEDAKAAYAQAANDQFGKFAKV